MELVLNFWVVSLIHCVIGQQRSWPITQSAGSTGNTGGTIKLGSYRVNSGQITLSGFSSGGSFAQQVQISYSSLFSGIAVYSHTYYKCGPGNGVEKDYDDVCTTLGGFDRSKWWDPNRTRRQIQQYANDRLIDPLSNLEGKRLYVYTGTYNWLFTTDQSLRILNIYEPLIRRPSFIMTKVQAANLSLPSDTFGGTCEADSANNFLIANCEFSGPYDALKFLLGDFIRKPDPRRPLTLQTLQTFDQREFFAPGQTGNNTGMDDIGYLYIPGYCRGGLTRCYLHFYFHGCTLGREFVSDNHIRRSGYLELAEENGIIVVFPMAIKMRPENEIGCWDTYGLTGPLFATQKGVQVSIIRKMLSRILTQTPEYQNSESGNNAGYNGRPNYDRPSASRAPSAFQNYPQWGTQNRESSGHTFQNRHGQTSTNRQGQTSTNRQGQSSFNRWSRNIEQEEASVSTLFLNSIYKIQQHGCLLLVVTLISLLS